MKDQWLEPHMNKKSIFFLIFNGIRSIYHVDKMAVSFRPVDILLTLKQKSHTNLLLSFLMWIKNAFFRCRRHSNAFEKKWKRSTSLNGKWDWKNGSENVVHGFNQILPLKFRKFNSNKGHKSLSEIPFTFFFTQ